MKYILIMSIAFTIAALPQKKLTAQEAVRLALQKNTLIQKSNENIRSSESSIKSAKGEFYPSVNASAGWNWRRSDYEEPVSGSLQSRTYSVGASSNVVLYDGLANFNNYERSERGLEIARKSLSKLKQDIVFQVLSGYYDIINAEKLLEVAEKNVAWNKKNYEIIAERNRLGSVTLADVYSSQVKVGNAELEVVRSKNNIETLKSNFLYTLGLDVLERYTFEEPSVESTAVIDSAQFENESETISALVDKALNARADIAVSKLQIENAKLGVRIAEAGHLPRLSNSISLGASNSTLGTMFDNRSYSVGLSLDVPVFSGWSIETRVELAAIEAKVKEIEHSDLLRDMKREVNKAFLDLTSANKQLEVGRKTVRAAEENLRIEEEKYSLGSTTLLNVLIANSEYTNATVNYINTQYNFKKLNDRMRYVIGSLSIE